MPSLRTPLYDTHIASGARMVPFAGWDMPVQYPDGVIREVNAVRTAAGIFDVSHMARFEITGDYAAHFLDTLLSQPASKLRHGQAKYHVICNAEGGIIDDAIVYNLEPNRYLLVSNAGNAPEVKRWLTDNLSESSLNAELRDITDDIAMIALQGPRAIELASAISNDDAARIRRFSVGELTMDGERVLAARTGYTGEDGFEVMCDAGHAPTIWELLVQHGAAPCGLGARDVLRLEAGLLLHGSDMTVANNPYEVGLDWTVTPDRAEYIARDALLALRDSNLPRRLTGFKLTGRGIARNGHEVYAGDTHIGTVSSGTWSPTLNSAIGLVMVNSDHAEPGTAIRVDVRGRMVDGMLEKPPFYRRG